MNMSEKHTLSEYEVEDQQLADSILKFNYYTYWTKGDGKLELFVTLDNGGQKCFDNYFEAIDLIYPQKFEVPEQILSNVKKILSWYIVNKYRCDISLFGDGWIDTPLFKDVMEELYSSFKGTLFAPKNVYITIPVQCFSSQFCIDYLNQIYHSFKDDLNINIIYQIYAIGAEIDKLSNDVYRALFLFLVDNEEAEVISTIFQKDIFNWETNAKWWATVPSAIFNRVLFKVGTSNEWEKENLLDFQKALKILSEKVVSSSNLDLDNIANEKINLQKLFINCSSNRENDSITQIHFNNFTKGIDFLGYDIHDSLSIRCGDLAVPISKGLCYDELLIGKFSDDASLILKFDSIRAERFIPKIYTKLSCVPHCEACPYVGICPGFDPAEAFYVYFDPFIAVRKHCDLQKIYLKFMIKNLDSLGVFDDLSSIGISASERIYFEDLLRHVRETDNR